MTHNVRCTPSERVLYMYIIIVYYCFLSPCSGFSDHGWLFKMKKVRSRVATLSTGYSMWLLHVAAIYGMYCNSAMNTTIPSQ